MAKKDPCYDAVKAALPDLKGTEVRAILDELDNIRTKVFEQGDKPGSAEFRARAMDLVNEMRFQAAAARKAFLENIAKAQRELDFVKQPAFEKKPWEAVKSWFRGSTGLSKGGNDSIEANMNGWRADILNQFSTAIKEAGLTDIMKNGMLDREIAQELFEMRDGGSPGISKSVEAIQAAKIFRAAQSKVVEMLQMAGSSIRTLDGYIMKQVHDRSKVLEAGFDKWMSDIMPKLDHDRTFGTNQDPAFKRETMQNVWKDIVGGKYDLPPDESMDPLSRSTGDAKDLNARTSYSRSLHFIDGNQFWDYNSQYGNKNLTESLIASVSQASRAAALMDKFGTRPKEQFDRLVNTIEKSLGETPELLQKFREKKNAGEFENLWKQAQGVSDLPGTSLLARTGQNARAITGMGKLGMAWIHAWTDMSGALWGLKSGSGKNMFELAHGLATDYFSALPSAAEREKWASRLGIWLKDVQGEMLNQFGGPESKPGLMSKMQHIFYKINILAPHDQAAVLATAKQAGMILADHAGVPFEELPGRFKANLERYGIDDKTWAGLSGAVENYEGQNFMSPEGVDKLDPSVFGGEKGKFEAKTKILSYLNDHAMLGLPRPDLGTKAFLNQGTRDEGFGVILRLWAQLKGFAFQQTKIATRITSSNPNGLELSDAGHLAGFILLSTGLGYLSKVAHDFAMGKTPVAPTPKIALDSMVSGGALGMYGDFLLGEYDRRYGRDAAKAFLGPTLSGGFDLINAASELRQGKADAGKEFRNLMGYVPFQNLWFAKGALDHFLLNHANEALNPGYTNRLEQRTYEKPGLFNENQDYLFYKPTGSSQ